MQTADPSENLVNMYQTTRCRITIVWHCLMWPVLTVQVSYQHALPFCFWTNGILGLRSAWLDPAWKKLLLIYPGIAATSLFNPHPSLKPQPQPKSLDGCCWPGQLRCHIEHVSCIVSSSARAGFLRQQGVLTLRMSSKSLPRRSSQLFH